MRASTWATLRSVQSRSRPPTSCRRIVNQRTSNPRRQNFHTSVSKRRSEDDPKDGSKASTSEAGAPAIRESEDPVANLPRLPGNGSDNGSGSPRPKDPNNYGSASNRARRNRTPKELPPVHIPEWFFERNVTLFDDVFAENPAFVGGETTLEGVPHQSKLAVQTKKNTEDITSTLGQKTRLAKSENVSESRALVQDLATPRDVMEEVLRMLKGVMTIPPAHYADSAASMKSHVDLYCPKNGASQYLIQMVKQLTVAPGRVDYLRLDAQDIAEIGGSYMENPETFESNTLSSLGYETSVIAAQRQAQATEQPGQEPGQEEEFDVDEEEDFGEGSNNPSFSLPFSKSSDKRGSINVGMGIIPVGSLIGNFQEAFKSFGKMSPSGSSSSNSKSYMINVPQEIKDSSQDLKMGLLVETLLNAPEKKTKAKEYTRHASGPGWAHKKPDLDSYNINSIDSLENAQPTSNSLIIFIEDYPQIYTTMHGGKFLDKLHEVVDAKRREGHRVVIVGTASTNEMMPVLSKSSVNEVQAEPSSGPMRTIIVPVSETTPGQVLVREHKSKVRAINLRHLRDMMRRLAPAPGQVGPIVDDWSLEIDSKTAFLADLDESVWSMDRVNRVATFALGARGPAGVEVRHIEQAIAGIYATDQAKYAWVKEEKANERRINKKPERRKRDAEERIRKLRTKCNSHEKKLLSGVVDANSIRTTFADVRAPPETIDALKTLTSLSLVRPDAFTYGVLATDRIPGLLLYGPPGTGKTLLAKAVAKESGATVLEVSGSDVYDMYVGEGEKNVRAIFSLAKKLAPCIIFIDEADAILGSRSGSSNRTSHRELINQFLREWDGMTDLNAFIMVATNRPFDLDEASLRRLPRRLLVDLPVEKDREAILKIHLKDEILDPEVSLSKLASETPFYSGSDLKNLCVAAALACVREEFDIAAEHNKNVTKDTPDAEKYKYAEKRTLHERHFAKGMDEISASISEDMGSLSAIRKFDEKYGDRRGRRKKLGGYGFRTAGDSEAKGSDAARVRNQ